MKISFIIDKKKSDLFSDPVSNTILYHYPAGLTAGASLTPTGQLISKFLFCVFNFFQKRNKNTSHSLKTNSFVCFFGRIYDLTICFRNYLTFTTYGI